MLTAKVGAHIWFWQVKIFCEPYGLIWIQKSGKTDPKIQKSGFLDPDPSVGLRKKIILTKIIYGLPLLLLKKIVRPSLLGGPLVKFMKIWTDQYYSP